MNSNCLVILSNSKYQDLWESLILNYKNIFFLKENFDIYITTDNNPNCQLLHEKYKINFLIYPSNLSWFDSLRFVVNQYLFNHYKYALFTFDDLFIYKVSKDDIIGVLCREFNYYKLLNTHVNIYNYFDCNGGELNLRYCKDSYIGSLVFTIFNVDYFSDLISKMPKDLNPWEYELQVSHFINDKSNFFCAKKSLIKYHNLVIKGKLDPISKALLVIKLKKEININRNKMSFYLLFKHYVKIFIWVNIRFFFSFSFHRRLRFRYS